MIQIDWSNAPDWANYHAFDEGGTGYWYEKSPIMRDNFWSSKGKYLQSGYEIPIWKDSLTSRPAAQTEEQCTK